MRNDYIKIDDLYVYIQSVELCDLAWAIYNPLDWRDKKINMYIFI